MIESILGFAFLEEITTDYSHVGLGYEDCFLIVFPHHYLLTELFAVFADRSEKLSKRSNLGVYVYIFIYIYFPTLISSPFTEYCA